MKFQNLSIRLDNGITDAVRFGTGKKTLVMIPGVGDGFQTVKGVALPMAWQYRKLTRDFTVIVFSRPRLLPSACTTREMASWLAAAMQELRLPPSCVLGISQGGMIAQYLAIDHPEMVERLILTVTTGRRNAVLEKAIAHWKDLAARGDYSGILLDTAERSYTPERLKSVKRMYLALGSFAKVKDFTRFITEADSCLAHDAWKELPRISCPTLVIGGTKDAIVSGSASEELAERIPGSEIYMYEGLSHGLYEEADDFLDRVTAFFGAEGSK